MEQQATHVEISQDIDAPVEKVFAAWTEPEQLKVWWKPIDNKLSEVVNELKEGGNIDYRFEGNTLHISGQYSQVQENKLLEYTWNWEFPEDKVKNASYKLTVNFSGEGDRSKISVVQEAGQNEESLLPHEHGWKDGLQALKTFVESK